MSMQIGQMISHMLGDMQPTEAKSLELKVGQIVKGMVLQLLGEQDALVNIGGVHMRAKLETPLRQGQVTHFQVQPESNGSQIVLKPVQGQQTPLTDDSIADMIRSFGMKDQPDVRQLAKVLQQSDIELTKANMQRFGKIMEQPPVDIPSDQWLESAVIAHKRNLPMTPESVRSLREAMFGQPLLGQLDGLEARAEETAKAMASLPDKASAEVKELVGKLQQAIRLVRESAGPAVSSGSPIQPDIAAGENAVSTRIDPETSGKPAAAAAQRQAQASAGNLYGNMQLQGGIDEQGNPVHSAQERAAAPDEQTRAEPPNRLNQTVTKPDSTVRSPMQAIEFAPPQTNGTDTNRAADIPRRPEGPQRTDQPVPKTESTIVPQRQTDAPPPPETRGLEPARAAESTRKIEAQQLRTDLPVSDQSAEAEAADSVPRKAAEPAERERIAARQTGIQEQDGSQGRPPAKVEENWINRLFKAVGMDHEHQVSRAIEKSDHRPQANESGIAQSALIPGEHPEPNLPTPGINRHEAADSLKSILLQLSTSDVVPEPLREQAQQTLQQITGQQLLLSPDRGAVLSHVTLFLPVRHEGGGEHAAAVHVQSRKGKRGEIDARNCRLLFDLNMQTLGLTLVDVQVFDRKVHLQVHNDMPFLGSILERYRGEIEEGLRQNGYQCMSLKCAPFPQPIQYDGDAAPAANSSAIRSAAASAYHIKPYKGVDVRV
ncbi:hypothetical protein FE783_03455 [Paenibacillus mesophilus]|uniref:hypothetical protein n=1 Tax=Paenibacillus mesophilus TaxID=2582849 RepID=UPI00110F0721|nr:hypothetical protein [Paenibacillus mesophilus]TMV52012.1 hypothetical protein FE783_03455 [Paenibacillus mesophilus]